MAGRYYHFDGGHRVQVTECGLGGGQATRAQNPDVDTVVCLRMGMVMTVGSFHRGHVEWVRDNEKRLYPE